ncbi:MAG: hypothetical protein QOH32_489 [Bradyrhizobium sp.]|jgi:hypothetical protein|nr:hypothetical protein [Bradyrhizobium sp.]
MNIKATGRTALIIAAGFWVCMSCPLQAAEESDGGVAAAQAEVAPGAPVVLSKFRKSRHWKHASSQRKPVRVASRGLGGASKRSILGASVKKKTVELVRKDDDAPSALPSSIANARAQLADADVSAGGATALSQARDRLQLMAADQSDPATAAAPAADTELVAADQLNEVDRALSEAKTDEKANAPAATLAMAVAQTPAAASTDDSSWGQASLIGKIFIAFGGLLTLASAARMFMT